MAGVVFGEFLWEEKTAAVYLWRLNFVSAQLPPSLPLWWWPLASCRLRRLLSAAGLSPYFPPAAPAWAAPPRTATRCSTASS